MTDEGWGAFLLRDMPQIGITQYYMYFKNVFQGNIFAVRLGTIFMELLGSFLFSYGLFSFFKNRLSLTLKDFFVILSFSFFSMFGVLSMYIYYGSMTKFVMFMAIGFILCGFSVSQPWIEKTCIIFSGLFLGTIFFIMPTNFPIIFFATLLIYFLTENQKRFHNICLLLIGVFSSILFYFVFIESFSVYMNGFQKAISITVNDQFDDNHGLSSIIQWCKKTILFFFKDVFTGVLVLYGIGYLSEHYKSITAKIILLLYLIIFLIAFLKYYPHPTTEPFYIVFLFLFLSNCITDVLKNRKKEFFLFTFIFITPVICSLGTDLSFELRSYPFVSLLLPVIYILIIDAYRKQIYYILFIILCSLYFFHNIFGYNRTNWADVVYTEQTNLIQPLTGQYLYLDAAKYQIINELKSMIHPEDYVIFNSTEFWGYAYLLETKPVSYSWRFNEEKILQEISENKKNIQSVKCLCFKDSTFDPVFLENVKSKIAAHSIVKYELSSIIVYICQ